MPTFIALPNGDIVNAATIVSVQARKLDPLGGDPARYPPQVLLIYNPSPGHSCIMEIACQSLEDAKALRDRIIAQMNEVGPIIQV